MCNERQRYTLPSEQLLFFLAKFLSSKTAKEKKHKPEKVHAQTNVMALSLVICQDDKVKNSPAPNLCAN